MMMRKSAGAAASAKRSAASAIGAGSSKQMPTLQDFLATRDFTGESDPLASVYPPAPRYASPAPGLSQVQ